MTKATRMIAAERERQIDIEGYTAAHDERHAPQLIAAARVYADDARRLVHHGDGQYKQIGVPGEWPWGGQYYKPTGDPVRDLVKAGALIAAAIDSLVDAAEPHISEEAD